MISVSKKADECIDIFELLIKKQIKNYYEIKLRKEEMLCFAV